MIIYDLKCSEGHRFEGWFKNLKDLNGQLKKKLLTCPVCGSEDISRRPSTFAVVKKSTDKPASQAAINRQSLPEAQQTDARKLINELEKLSSRLERDFADVGSNFANEALKMHYGVTPKRNIRGISTNAQEEILRKEGVDFLKIPFINKKKQASGDKN